MYELTHKNHFKFGYNHEWFRFRQSLTDEWMVSYGACERPAQDFKAECVATAALIRDTTSGPLTLLFSGGADSEVVLLAFHELGIPVNVAICQFSNNLNIHDISYAVICCEQLGIPYKIFQLDIDKFMSNWIYGYAEATKARNPQVCSTMWLADQVDGVPIIGSGECYIVKRVPDEYIDGESPYDPTPWDLYEREGIAAWFRHFMIPGKERMAVPGFFQHTPEIMLSFAKDERVLDLVNDRVIGKRSTVTSKFNIYKRYFPTLIPRKKYNGFENLLDWTTELREQFKMKWPANAACFRTEYHDFIDMLNGKIEGPKGISVSNLEAP